MTRAAQPPASTPAPTAVPGPTPARRGDAIDQWLGMFTRFLRLPHAQSKAIKDELDSHMRERVRDLMLEGLSEDEGMRRAIDELGEAAELAAHFRAAHLPNRRLAMSIAAFGVAAGAAVVSIVALSQSQPQPAAPAQPVVVSGVPLDPIVVEGKPLTVENVRTVEGVPMLKDIPIVGSLFVSGEPKAGQSTPPVKINVKYDAPTIRAMAALLAEHAGKRLSLNAGEADVNHPLASVEFVDADASTVLRVMNDRAGLTGPSRFDARYKGDVVEIAPISSFDKQESSLIAYDLTAAIACNAKTDDLIETVTQFVESDGWRENGGETARLKVVGNKMFVEAPPRYHERVEWIIAQFTAPKQQRFNTVPKATGARASTADVVAAPAAAAPVASLFAHGDGSASGGSAAGAAPAAPSSSPFGSGTSTTKPVK